MKCPNCRKQATLDHFRTSPDCASKASSLCAILRGSKRVNITRAGGRPKKVNCDGTGRERV